MVKLVAALRHSRTLPWQRQIKLASRRERWVQIGGRLGGHPRVTCGAAALQEARSAAGTGSRECGSDVTHLLCWFGSLTTRFPPATSLIVITVLSGTHMSKNTHTLTQTGLATLFIFHAWNGNMNDEHIRVSVMSLIYLTRRLYLIDPNWLKWHNCTSSFVFSFNICIQREIHIYKWVFLFE